MHKCFSEALISLKAAKPEQIPPFAEGSIKFAQEEMVRLSDEMKIINQKIKAEQDVASNEEITLGKGKMALYFDHVYRVKRFMMVYLSQRHNKIEQQFWYFGGDINNEQKQNLSTKEKSYFLEYKGLVMNYMDQVGVDLTLDLDPPLQTEVEVRFSRDCGEIIDEKGQVLKLDKNSGIFMKKKLAEPFIKQGYASISH